MIYYLLFLSALISYSCGQLYTGGAGSSTGSSGSSFSSCNVPNYRVVAVPGPGFVAVTGNSSGTYYSGFIIDLLYAMSRVGKFTFTILPTPASGFGTLQANGCWTGAVGSLLAGEADIIGGDVANSGLYDSYVDFTVPIYQSSVQALYNTNTGLNGVKYAVISSGNVRYYFENAANSRDQAIWANILTNSPTSLPLNYNAAVQLVLSGGWAFIGRTLSLDQTVSQFNGILAKAPTVYENIYASLGVGLGNTNVRQRLNAALNRLQEDGTVNNLLKAYFPTSNITCN